MTTQSTLAQAYFNPRIRREYVDDVEYLSIVDIMAEFTDLESRPSVLWQRTKKRLQADGFDVYQSVIQLKLVAKAGKRYKTDCADGQTVLRIIQSIPSKNAESVREWLASLGYRDMQEKANPELAVMRRRAELKKLTDAGYGNHPQVQWLKDRDENIAVFKSLKALIATLCEKPEWGALINAEYMALFGVVSSQLEIILNTKSVRNGLPSLQLRTLTLAESVLQEMLKRHNTLSNEQIKQAIDIAITPLGQNAARAAAMSEEDHKLRAAEHSIRDKWTDEILTALKSLTVSFQEYPRQLIREVTTEVRTIAESNLKSYNEKQVAIAEELNTMSENNGKLSAAIEELKAQIEQLKDEIKGTVIIGHNQATKLTDTLNAVLMALTEISSKIDTQTMKAAANTTTPSTPLIETKETESE